ncbi:MAG TPA: hypothetical protein VMA09_06525 [Candidatus Binataceae bacterium]|nr:hypothetical protein [Candidatus Binataceae bacterium]
MALDDASRDAILETARTLKLRTGQLVVTIEELDEISVREQTTPAEILARDSLRRIIENAGSAPGRARAFVDKLNAVRFPMLRQTSDDLAAAVAALKLPRGVSVVLPKALSSDELAVALKFRTMAELERMLAVLDASRPALGRILDKLGGK